jgi:hypothetical protein
MTRHETLEAIKGRLEYMDTEALSALLVLLDHQGERLSASGLPYTGDPETDEVLDNPEITNRLLAWKATFAGLSPEEASAKLEEMRECGELIPLEQVLIEEDARRGLA